MDGNRQSELCAFAARLGEPLAPSVLDDAFTHCTYDPSNTVSAALADKGRSIATDYIRAFLRHQRPLLPEEGVSTVCDRLLSPTALGPVSQLLGTKDLILSNVNLREDAPWHWVAAVQEVLPSTSLLSDTLLSIVGLVATEQSVARAENLVLDYILTQLADVDMDEWWCLAHPEQVLNAQLAADRRPQAEARLLRSAGVNTAMPVYVVGLYVDRELIGEAPGESAAIAREMAARAALRSRWAIDESSAPPLAFGSAGRALDLSACRRRPNSRLGDLRPPPPLDTVDARADEPLRFEQIYADFQERTLPALGTPLRRRLRHKFSKGSYAKTTKRQFIKVKPFTI